MRKERKNVRFDSQKLRKSFANGNPKNNEICGNSLEELHKNIQ